MRKYITDDINNVLDVLHLQSVYVVNTLEDCAVLKQTLRYFNIASSEFLIYRFDSTVNEEANQVPVFENVPMSVKSMPMEYGSNLTVTVILFTFKCLFFYIS